MALGEAGVSTEAEPLSRAFSAWGIQKLDTWGNNAPGLGVQEEPGAEGAIQKADVLP